MPRAVETPRRARYVSVRAEAERLGIGKSILFEAVRDGAWPHRRVGTRILIDPDESDEFLLRTGATLDEAVARAREL